MSAKREKKSKGVPKSETETSTSDTTTQFAAPTEKELTTDFNPSDFEITDDFDPSKDLVKAETLTADCRPPKNSDEFFMMHPTFERKILYMQAAAGDSVGGFDEARPITNAVAQRLPDGKVRIGRVIPFMTASGGLYWWIQAWNPKYLEGKWGRSVIALTKLAREKWIGKVAKNGAYQALLPVNVPPHTPEWPKEPELLEKFQLMLRTHGILDPNHEIVKRLAAVSQQLVED